MRKRTKLQIALYRLDACGTSVHWVNGQPPAEAWKNCKRPDWLFWLIARLAMHDQYYYRALCSAVAVSIDVLTEADMVCICALCLEEHERYANQFSMVLDRIAQGRPRGKIPESPQMLSDPNCIPTPMINLLWVANELVEWPKRKTIPRPDLSGNFIGMWNLKLKLRKKLCDEIRRVVQRPTLKDLQELVKKEGRYDRYC